MIELMRAGRFLMIPIVICSVLITAIVIERLWTLDAKKVSPKNLVPQIWVWLKNDQLNSTKLKKLRESSPLGVILAAGVKFIQKW